ncbi:hypothetical protein [Asticcacaulis sp. W401b]|uniref:hypothetical protein n=1 Tax=Asticcacaulis sp. W401b TaxID=3388666 RepID=UPI00397068F1
MFYQTNQAPIDFVSQLPLFCEYLVGCYYVGCNIEGMGMDWLELVSNEDLKPKVEVTGLVDRLVIRFGKSVSDRLKWRVASARVQYADAAGRSLIRVLPDAGADWQLTSAGKGGGLVVEAVQLAPDTVFEAVQCVCDICEDGSAVITLPIGYRVAKGEMIKKRRK